MPNLTVTKNYSDGVTLTKAHLDDAFSSIETFLNTTKLDGTNIQSGAIADTNLASLSVIETKIASSAVTTAKIADDAITTAKILDSNITLAKLAAAVQEFLLPTGVWIGWPSANSVPTGWLLMDGSAVSRTDYARLFAVIGTTHGHGDGSTTFNLPDYRGRFVRGVDGTAGNDPDASSRTAMAAGGNTGNNVGSVQADELKSHTHDYKVDPASGASSGVAFSSSSSTRSTLATGGNETRPKNAYSYFIIKT